MYRSKLKCLPLLVTSRESNICSFVNSHPNGDDDKCFFSYLDKYLNNVTVKAGNPIWRERISTVDLIVLASSDQLLFVLKKTIFLSYKTRYLNEEVNCTGAPPFSKGSLVSRCPNVVTYLIFCRYLIIYTSIFSYYLLTYLKLLSVNFF